MECDGGCLINGECKGEVIKVRVVGPSGAEWGTYNYCQAAIDTDRRNGYFVEEEKEHEMFLS